MILEAAHLTIKPGREAAFEAAMQQARPLIEASAGFGGIEVRRCIERPSGYLLLVWWEAMEDHTAGFRGSGRYEQWRTLLHDFYDPFPTVEHFAPSFLG
ncbi:antibiotic biosynthesis monooxygenase [Emcibacter sp. SYSU 3D8]|uniref:antibiotic biosynthesis monooxygenase family protein n=1 Tax=Emcibacter sp. SYSU 3D8 TaxID=3133969 RepID=UPI0031FE7FDA